MKTAPRRPSAGQAEGWRDAVYGVKRCVKTKKQRCSCG